MFGLRMPLFFHLISSLSLSSFCFFHLSSSLALAVPVPPTTMHAVVITDQCAATTDAIRQVLMLTQRDWERQAWLAI